MRAELAPLRAELEAAVRSVIENGIFIGGPEVSNFEAALARDAQVAHVVGVSSGTDALLAVLMALGIGPGDEIVTTPFTFVATASAAARLGARVVFADVDDASLTLDADATRAACSARTRAIIPVHLFGHPARMTAVPTGCALVEDAAQSLGGIGLHGVAAATSFFPTKNLGAFGDAGAVLTNDAALAARIRLLRTQGAQPRYHHVAIGGNFRLDALQAAVLATKLPHLAAWTAARRAHAARYRSLFASVALPPELRLPQEDPQHVYHQFVIRAPRRDALRAALARDGIGTEVYYPEPLHLQPCFADLGYRAGSFPKAERASTEVLALPIHPALATRSLERVVEAIASFYR